MSRADDSPAVLPDKVFFWPTESLSSKFEFTVLRGDWSELCLRLLGGDWSSPQASV